jgi:tRNA A37 threonylcarbamoyladenosine dehydratase
MFARLLAEHSAFLDFLLMENMSSSPDSHTALGPLPDADLERRFGSLARLYGTTGAQRIRQAHVVVVGLGGVGSWAAEALARSGVARLSLIDLDHIAESNINRQVHALDTTVGQAKVRAMCDRILHINPACEVDCIEEFADADNWPTIAGLNQPFDRTLTAVIDACDQVRAKTALTAWALKNKAFFVTVGAAGGKRLAHKVDIDDLAAVTHDPLLAQLRYRLRKEHGVARDKKMNVACVFSREAVLQPDTTAQTDGSLNCHGYGSVVSVTSTFGMCAAGWIIGKFSGDF